MSPTIHDNRQRFDSLEVGAKFFDPLSGEHFVKHNDRMATFASGGDGFEGEASRFEADELVVPA